jgi:hypothetical protein
VDEAEPASVLFVEARPPLVTSFAVQVEIVPDDVDAAALVPLRERVHEREQRVGIAMLDDAAEDLARTDVEGRQLRFMDSIKSCAADGRSNPLRAS